MFSNSVIRSATVFIDESSSSSKSKDFSELVI